MIFPIRMSINALHLTRPSIKSSNILQHRFPPCRTTRAASSFGAVWKGIRREDSGSRGQRSASRPPGPRRTFDRNDDARDVRGGRLPAGRPHFKIKKALQKQQEREQEDEGRKSRSKRFNQPDYTFGKKSLVYQLNKGGLKDKITDLVEAKRARAQASSQDLTAFGQRRNEDGRLKNRSTGDGRRDRRTTSTRQESDDNWLVSQSRENKTRERERSTPGRATSSSSWTSDRPSDIRPRDRPDRREPRSTENKFRDRTGSQNPRVPERTSRGLSETRDGRFSRGRRFSEAEETRKLVRKELNADDQDKPYRRERRFRDEADTMDDHASRGDARGDDGFPTTLPYTTAASQFLFGRWPVTAALKEARRQLYNLYIYSGSTKDATHSIRSLAEKQGVRVTMVPESKQHVLDNLSKGRPHNGLVLETSPLPQLPINSLGPATNSGYTVDIARQSKEDVNVNGSEPFQPWKTRTSHNPLIVLLHEVMDPGNLGAILRTARFLGAAAVAITQHTSSPITSTAIKAAAGAAEELTIFSVADPLNFLETSSAAGWESYVAVAPGSSRSTRQQLTLEEVAEEDVLRQKPCILVLGNEGEGLSKRILSKADRQISISRHSDLSPSSVDSLNVSVAAALLIDSFTKGMRSIPQSLEAKLRQDAKKAALGEILF